MTGIAELRRPGTRALVSHLVSGNLWAAELPAGSTATCSAATLRCERAIGDGCGG